TGSVSSVAFSPNGKRLASADGVVVKLWDAQTGQVLQTFQRPSRNVLFSPDGKRLASASGRGRGEMLDAQTGQVLRSFEGGGGLAFSPDGKRLATAGGNSVKVWDVQSGQEQLTLPFDKADESVAFSPDGKRLASAARDSTVKVWDAQS